MDRGYNVRLTQVELIFYSKCKLIIVISVVTYTGLIIVHSFMHSFIADIYIAPLQVGLLRSAPNPSAAE